MDEFGEYISKRYNVKITKYGISCDDGFYYIFQLSTQQQYRMYCFENYQIKEFIFRAKMMVVEKTMVPLAQINGGYEYIQGQLKLSGSMEFIELMLYQLFESIE